MMDPAWVAVYAVLAQRGAHRGGGRRLSGFQLQFDDGPNFLRQQGLLEILS